MIARLTCAALRLRVLILCGWLAVLAVGAWSATELPDVLSSSFAVPGSDSERAHAILARRFRERPDGTFTVVVRARRPSDPAVKAQLRRRLATAAHVLPAARVGPLREGAGVLYGEIATGLDARGAERYTEALRRALAPGPGPAALVTGPPAIQHDLEGALSFDLRRGEAAALLIALLALVAALGLSPAIGMPFLFAACAVAASLTVVYGLAHMLSMATYVTNLLELIGLGLAVDYSLLVVHRFREELHRGLETSEAVLATMATAGRAAVVSGLSVAIGLGLLALIPVPLLRSLGISGLVVPLVSVGAVVTLQPALLALLGPRWVRRASLASLLGKGSGRAAGPRGGRPGLWARLAVAIIRRPRIVLAAGTATLLAAAAPAFFLELTPGSLSYLPRSPEAMRGWALLLDRVGPGAVTPTHLVVDTGGPERVRQQPVERALDRLVRLLAEDTEPYVIARGRRPPYVDRAGRYARLVVVGRHEYGEEATRSFIRRLRARIVPQAAFPRGVRVFAGGAPPQGVDFLDRAYGAFSWLIPGVLVLTYVVLLRAFRSLLLPLKAVLLNGLSVAAVYGLLTVIFTWGLGGRLLGLDRTGPVEAWVPLFLFAALFGLSMDYEVFMVSRMREAWDGGADNAGAVVLGLERTGRIVTAAAAIMAASFSGFIGGRVTGLQQLGVGLVLGILLDATLVRAVLVPSLMSVLDRYNWWLPEPVARLAGVAPSPLASPSRPV